MREPRIRKTSGPTGMVQYTVTVDCDSMADALVIVANMLEPEQLTNVETIEEEEITHKGNGTAAGTILKIMQTGKKGAEWSTRDLESALSMTKYKGYERKNISAQLGWMAKSGKVKRVGDKPARYTAV